MSLYIPRETIEKLKTVITSDIDPTADVVAFAFTLVDDRPSTWTAGTWTSTWSGGRTTAVTPTIGVTGSDATVELAVGTWHAWVRVTDNPEVPVRQCGVVRLS